MFEKSASLCCKKIDTMSRKLANRALTRALSSGSSRWLPAAGSLSAATGEDRDTSRSVLAAWGAALMAGVVAMNSDDGVSRCDRAVDSPMGKTPESKLAQPHFYLSDEYRRRIFFNYERRLRLRSPPEKVFTYFSSVRTPEGYNYMTAGDLMRAVVPVFPPSGSSQVREGYLAFERSPGELRCPPSKLFLQFDTNGDGLISFAEYIFFTTLLSIPEKNFKATFRMFDVDGDGVIDREEFKKIMAWMRSHTHAGKTHSDGRRTGLHVSGDVENAGLVELFFGKDGTRKLPMEQFEQFLKDLHNEIITLEFAHYDFDNRGSISATDFGLSMAASADLSKTHHYLDRVQDLANIPHFASMRISLQEFMEFAELRKKIPVMALAISSFGKISGKLSKNDVMRAANKICHAPISDNVVDVIFHIFDTDQDGVLSMDEFLGVLQRRERDLADPSDSGIVQFLKCWWTCASDCHKPWGL